MTRARQRARPIVLAAMLVAGVLPAADIASGEVVVVVSAENPIREIRKSELSDLFLGRASRFPDGRSAVPIDLSEGSEARPLFYQNYLGRSLAQMKAHWSKIIFTGRGSTPREARSSEELRRLVANDPRAIGYLERGMVDASVRIVPVE